MSSSEHCYWQTLCNPNLVDQVEGTILALLRTAFRSPKRLRVESETALDMMGLLEAKQKRGTTPLQRLAI